MRFLIFSLILVCNSVFALAAGTGSPQTANTVFAGPASAGPTVPTFRALVVADLPTVTAAKGGTGVANGASCTLTLPNAATTITTGGTIALGGFTLTVPATGTTALTGTSNTFTAQQIFTTTTPTNTTQNLTAGTMTASNQSEMRTVIHKYSWTNAMVTALGATTTGNVAVCTLPAKTVVKNAYVVIVTSGATVTTLTVSVGTNSTTYDNFVLAGNAKAGANTVYGDAKAELGTALYDATTILNYMGSFTGTTLVNAQFISTGGNLSTVTTSTGSIYLETYTLP